MFTDLVGSTELAQRDEKSALALLREQEALAEPLLTEHSGRLVKSTGDGMLIEFANVRDAVECSVAYQRVVRERNAGGKTPPLRVRIGIHAGDVESKGADILGDAVNLAARVEPLAEPGGVCLSGAVYEQTHNKVPFPMERIGPKMLKGVLEPVEIYRVVLPWQRAGVATPTDMDRTRVAILPFANLSPDPTDDYFADGLTEELIGRLAQLKRLTVIARTSVMTYKRTSKKVSEIAQELSVGALVEGSVRKAGNRVRITVQLINAGTEGHVWSDRFDRDLDNIFAVQTEIAEKVARELNVKLVDSEKQVLERKPTQSTDAYGLFLRGRELLREGSEPSVRQALGLYEQAIALDPTFARAFVGVAECHQSLFQQHGVEAMKASLPVARTSLQRALELDPDLPEVHAALAELHQNEDDGPAQEAEARRAVELNPSLPEAHYALFNLAALKGEAHEMVREIETAYVLDPLRTQYIMEVGYAYVYTGRKKEAMEHWLKTEQLAPVQTAMVKTEYYLSCGDLEEAEEFYSLREKLPPSPSVWLTWMGGVLAALKGKNEKALLAIRTLEKDSTLGPLGLTYIGFVHYALGDLDSYFEYMDRALEAHTLITSAVLYSPLFDRARLDPRYRGLVEKLRRRTGFAKHHL